MEDQKNLPAFMREGADQSEVTGSLQGEADFCPAMMEHEPPNEKSESRQPEVLAKRAKNLRDLRKSDVIETTRFDE